MSECGREFRGPNGILWRCTREKHGPEPEVIERNVYGRMVTYTIPSQHWMRAVKEKVSQ